MTQVKSTLMLQYEAIKKKYPDAILLFRVGDYYEMLNDDAVKAAAILRITLTERINPTYQIAGFSHHFLDRHLVTLVKAGNRVALCDEYEEEKHPTAMVTPGADVPYDDDKINISIDEMEYARYLNYLGAPPYGELRDKSNMVNKYGKWLLENDPEAFEASRKIYQTYCDSKKLIPMDQRLNEAGVEQYTTDRGVRMLKYKGMRVVRTTKHRIPALCKREFNIDI